MRFERRECESCGIRFTPKRDRQRVCSDCTKPRAAESWAVTDASGEPVETDNYW